jgi:small conductance mechanosensitive channel
MKGQPKEEINKRVNTLSSAFVNAGIVLIVIFAIITILPEFGVNIGAMLAGLGIIGIAVGFGAQSLIKDLLAGIFILLEDQYRVGDVVSVAGIGGLVEEIGLRRTILRDLDGIVHSIPNGEIKTASNFTKGFSRVNLNISVAYGEDLDHVIEVINRVCKEMAEDPKWKADFASTPQVLRVDNLGDSGIDIKILGDTKPMRQWDAMGELRLRIKRTFDKEGIEIPWPHTKVYFGNSPPRIIEGGEPISKESTNTKN